MQIRYRPNDCGASRNDAAALLEKTKLESRALAGESYSLAFTPDLLANIYRRDSANLLPTDLPTLRDEAGYRDIEGNGHWWIPSGRAFFSATKNADPAEELHSARTHFFLSHRFVDPFGNTAVVAYAHDLVLSSITDAVQNQT